MQNVFTGTGSLLVIVFAFAAGALLGSFLNVVIYRLPRRESIVWPGSRCPSCGEPIVWYDNIPLLSFIILGGKCRRCGTKISRRYPATEGVVACMTAGAVAIHGLSLQMTADVLFSMILVAAAAIDLEFMIIPNRLTYPAMVIGGMYAASFGTGSVLRAFYGALIGVLILGFMFFIGRLLFKRDSMGFGDFKLAIVIGLFTGPFWTTAALVLAVLAGGIIGSIQLASGKKKRGQEIPFGPFLAFGGLAVIFFRPQVLFLVEQYCKLFHL